MRLLKKRLPAMPLDPAIELALPLIRGRNPDTLPDEVVRYRVGTSVLPGLIRIPFWGRMAPEQQAALIAFAWDNQFSYYSMAYFPKLSLALQTKDWERVPRILFWDIGLFGDSPWRQIKRRWQEARLWEQGLKTPAREYEQSSSKNP